MGQRAGVVWGVVAVFVLLGLAGPAMAQADDESGTEPTAELRLQASDPQQSEPNFADAGTTLPRDLITFSARVWMDANVNAIVDPDEASIPVVRVELFYDADGDGWPDDIDGDSVITLTDALAVTTTGADGRFMFESLDPGAYIAGIPPSESASGRALDGLAPSSPSPCLCLDGYIFSVDDFGFAQVLAQPSEPSQPSEQPEEMLPVTGATVTDLIVYGFAMVLIGGQIVALAVAGRKLDGNPFWY